MSRKFALFMLDYVLPNGKTIMMELWLYWKQTRETFDKLDKV